MSSIKPQKLKLTLTKLDKPELTGEQYRIDSISNLTLPYNLPFKMGDVLTSKQVDEIIKQNKISITRIQAEKFTPKI